MFKMPKATHILAIFVVVVVLCLIFSLFSLTMGVAEFQRAGPNMGSLTWILLGIIGLITALYAIGQLATRISKMPKPKRTITVVRCANCNFQERREFKRGDYVGKKVGKCVKCDGELFIELIYSEVIKRRRII